jgi:hypothetical protein
MDEPFLKISWCAWDTVDHILANSEIKNTTTSFPPRLVILVFNNGALKISITRNPIQLITSTASFSRTVIAHAQTIKSILISEPDETLNRLRSFWIDKKLRAKYACFGGVFEQLSPQEAIAELPRIIIADPLPVQPTVSPTKSSSTQFFERESLMPQDQAKTSERDLIVVAGTTIHQDEEGRYCLNELHKAAGADKTLQPSNWLRTDQTKELIAELESENENSTPHIRGAKQNQPVSVVNGGKNPGTYVCKELVYAYAMWISPKFHLAVIRAFDAMVMVQQTKIASAELPNSLTQAIEATSWRLAEEHRKHTESLLGAKTDVVRQATWEMAFKVKEGIKQRLIEEVSRYEMRRLERKAVIDFVLAWNPPQASVLWR